jgi:hypothetical protein
MKSLLVLALTVFQAAAAQPPAPSPSLPTALNMLQMAVAQLPGRLRSPRLVAAATWLKNSYARTRPETVSAEYVRSLQRASDLLFHMPMPDVVEDVTRELEAKVEHCRRLGIGMGGTVLLKVNTRQGARVVGDWQVFYLLKFDEWLKTPPRNFLRVSSPTEMNVEPGRYWLWARDPATRKTGERVLVQVAGQTEVVLDLPVP